MYTIYIIWLPFFLNAINNSFMIALWGKKIWNSEKYNKQTSKKKNSKFIWISSIRFWICDLNINAKWKMKNEKLFELNWNEYSSIFILFLWITIYQFQVFFFLFDNFLLVRITKKKKKICFHSSMPSIHKKSMMRVFCFLFLIFRCIPKLKWIYNYVNFRRQTFLKENSEQ